MTQRNTGSEWSQCHPPKETHSMGMGTIWLSRFNIFMEGTIDDNMNTTRLTLKEPVGWRTRRIGWRKLQLTGGFVNEYCIWGVDWSKREFHKELSGFHQSAEKQLYAPRPPPQEEHFLSDFFKGPGNSQSKNASDHRRTHRRSFPKGSRPQCPGA